jgi:hypothetical protein
MHTAQLLVWMYLDYTLPGMKLFLATSLGKYLLETAFFGRKWKIPLSFISSEMGRQRKIPKVNLFPGMELSI